MKSISRLLLSAGIGLTLLAGCIPARSVSIEFDNRPQRRIKVVPRSNVQLYRIQSHPHGIKIKPVPPGHQRKRGNGHGRGRGR